jgi:hypothetical protein
MFSALLQFLAEIATSPGWHVPRVIESLERPAVSAAAQKYRAVAFCLFMAMAFLFLSAAIVFVVVGPVRANELLGGSGIVAMHACIFCGLRYERLNRESTSSGADQPRRND